MPTMYIETEPHIFDNDDTIGQSLNNLHILLYGEETFLKDFDLSEAKEILRQSYVDYEILLKSIHLNNEHNFRANKKYKELIDRNKDNLQI